MMSGTPPKASKVRVPRACLRCRRQKLKVKHSDIFQHPIAIWRLTYRACEITNSATRSVLALFVFGPMSNANPPRSIPGGRSNSRIMSMRTRRLQVRDLIMIGNEQLIGNDVMEGILY